MHGRIKIRTTAEQLAAKKAEQEKKLKIYKTNIQKIFTKRENNENDEEALGLTKEFLQQNPGLYTLWNYRKEILLFMKPQKTPEEVQALGEDELVLTQVCLKQNPKSYEAWHHRFWSLEFMPTPDWDKELKLCNLFLSMDERNFHCWDYRRLICRKCEIGDEAELTFTTDLINKNFSNYSAWHYRSTLLPVVHPGKTYISVDEDILLKEYEMVQNAAFTDPNDQSVWFYHRWLLGRGYGKMAILSLAAVKKLQYVIVLLSCPVKVSAGCDFTLKVAGKEVETDWSPVGGVSDVTTLWYCKLPSNWWEHDGNEVSLYVRKGEEEAFLSCTMCECHVFKNAGDSNASIFCDDISAATKDVLEKELESCNQLSELEPENKWTVFTSMLLMRALSSQKYYSDICKNLKQLMKIDEMRVNYYRDLKSKIFIENVIENLPEGNREVCLPNKGLRTIHHFDHFYLMTKVDLSFNCLTSLKPLCYLLSVETLILDGNKLTTCEDIKHLKCLQHLSLKANYINSVCDLKSLTTCPELARLFLSINPVTEVLGYEKEIKMLFGKIILDGKHL